MTKRRLLSQIEDDPLAYLGRPFGDPNGPVFYDGLGSFSNWNK